MAENTLRTTPAEEESAPKKKREKKKKKTEESEPRDWGRLIRTGGLLLTLSSLFLLLSFIGFLFSAKADQSVVTSLSFTQFYSGDHKQIDNFMGLLGALTAHWFIYCWFGVSSFLLLPLMFLAGIRWMTGSTLYPFRRVFSPVIFSVLFLSVSLAYAFQSAKELDYLGGGFGFEFFSWLRMLAGNTGVAIILLATLFTYLILAYNISLSFSFLRRKIQEEDVQEVNPDSAYDGFIPNEIMQDETIKEDETDDIPEPELKTVEDEISAHTLTAEDRKTKLKNIGKNSDVSFEVKKTEEVKTTSSGTQKEEMPSSGSWYKYPGLDLLKNHSTGKPKVDAAELEDRKNQIVNTLLNYKISIDKIEATIGPTCTLYEIIPSAGIRISKIKSLEDDIALSLAALGIRIIAPIPGKGTIGIEVPNQHPEIVAFKEALSSKEFVNSTYDLPVILGKTITNEVYVADLASMPHLLMAGATGQGKSVGINTIIASILYKKHPEQVKFVLVDPKKVELSLYKNIENHFLPDMPDGQEAIITDTKLVVNVLKSLCIEMDERYDKLKEAQVRNIKEYNKKIEYGQLDTTIHKRLPYIILVIDELADLMMTAGKEVETPIARLAQLARAIGIHLIVATQRPSVNIITGVIKANFPARIAFRVSSKVDSRTILDGGGADQLIGRGDMLFSRGNDLIRLQCPFIDTDEIERVTDHIRHQPYPEPYKLEIIYDEEEGIGGGAFDSSDLDSMFEEAARMVVRTQQGSTSMLQRRLNLGYNRAGRVMDQLEQAGIVGENLGSKPREVLVSDELSLEQILRRLKG